MQSFKDSIRLYTAIQELNTKILNELIDRIVVYEKIRYTRREFNVGVDMQKENEIRAIVKKIKETVDCEKIYLFGSYAYGGSHQDSDLDFYVVLAPDSNLRPIEAIRIIRLNLGDINKIVPIDVIAARLSRIAEMSR